MEPTPSCIGRRRNARILLVDDDHELITSIALCLRAEGYRPDYVCNGQEALDWIDKHGHPDVILLDIDMPIMNGPEFMKAYDGPAAIIIITGWEKVELPREPFQTIFKPYKHDDLVSLIDDGIAASSAPKWARFLPCNHSCVTLDIKDDMLVFACLIPGCNKSKAVHKDKVDFETVLELTVSIAQDNFAREEINNLS